MIEADGLTIGSSNDGVALTARAMRLRLDPWRLLLGRVVVREVVLVGADIRLPWPPTRLPGLATLGLDELTLLDARLEESRISVAGASIEGVSARFINASGKDTSHRGTASSERRWPPSLSGPSIPATLPPPS